MRFRTRLLLILTPALAGLCLLAVRGTLEVQGEVDQLVTLRERLAFVGTLAEAAHQVQIERGLSAGFLASRGASFGPQLIQARGRTDAAAGAVLAAAAAPSQAGLAGLEEAGAVLKALGPLRAEVDGLRLEGKASFSRYTGTVERLLAVEDAVAVVAGQPELSRLALALAAFSAAKENAGRERATLNAVFTAGAFTAEQYERVLSVIATQEALFGRFGVLASDAGRRALADHLASPVAARARALRQEGLAAGLAGRPEVPAASWFEAATARIDGLREVERRLAGELVEQVDARLAGARAERLGQLALLAAVVLAAVALGLWQARAVMRQLGGEPEAVVAVMRRIAGGDLTEPVALAQGDAASILAEAAAMQDRIAGVIGTIHGAVTAVRGSIEHLTEGNGALAQRTAEQAADVERTAAGLQQLTAAVRQNAQTALATQQLASSSSATAERSGQVMEEMIGTVRAIEEVSARIKGIVGAIDEVSFQTNILALNAAVEAARAGSHGAGFMVVASEVRALSQRAHGLAREINGLIAESTGKVKGGVSQAQSAGKALEEVLGRVRQVDALMADVARSSAEQSQGISDISDALSRIDQGTQENSELVQRSTGSAQELEREASQLAEAVRAFRLAA